MGVVVFKHILAVSVALAAMACSVAADQFDKTRLFAHGAWSVDYTYNIAEGNSWCAAETHNRRGQVFSVVAHDGGSALVFVLDPGWSLGERRVRYRIDIDYERWDVQGRASGPGVSVLLNGSAEAGEFVAQLMRSSAVAAYSDDRARLATFSLDGSFAAIGAPFECWSRISGSDPFTNASDPF
jgi:hypothetical protein